MLSDVTVLRPKMEFIPSGWYNLEPEGFNLLQPLAEFLLIFSPLFFRSLLSDSIYLWSSVFFICLVSHLFIWKKCQSDYSNLVDLFFLSLLLFLALRTLVPMFLISVEELWFFLLVKIPRLMLYLPVISAGLLSKRNSRQIKFWVLNAAPSYTGVAFQKKKWPTITVAFVFLKTSVMVEFLQKCYCLV